MYAVKAYARDYCRHLGHPFTSRTIIVTAMSGVAATLLKGETAHSVLGLNRDGVQNEESELWADARLLIIDEISFASKENFEKMHEHLKVFMQCNFKLYGGLNVVFAGDYSQLEPVKRDPIYKKGMECREFHTALNCYIELDGKWRFQDDEFWGDIMGRVRDGNPTYDDINAINWNCLNRPVPDGIQVATYKNKDRDAVNASTFEECCKQNRPEEEGTILESACVILMDELYMNNSVKVAVPVTSNKVKCFFYENCNEDDCTVKGKGQGRVDPCLKVYPDAPLMLTQNSDVANGEANGSRILAKGVRLKQGEQAFMLKLDCGAIIWGVHASQVKSILADHQAKDIVPRRVEISSQQCSFHCPLIWALAKNMFL